MVTEKKVTSDVILQELGGCSRFQTLVSILPYLTHVPWAFSTLFMSFGSYDPGWRCLDARSEKDSYYKLTILDLAREKSLTSDANDTEGAGIPDYITDSCRGFQWCKNLDFDPEASTIVTEWGLECNRKWILSIIITLQMAGGFFGGLFVGCVGDKIGRKATLYSLLLIHVALNLGSMYSVSVEMFMALRFFIGASDVLLGKLPVVYVMEFVPPRWRMVVGCFPMWTIGSVLFAVSAVMTKDWFQVNLIIAGLSAFCFLPVIWVPESLRWLAVKGKTARLLSVGEKIAGINGKDLNHAQCCAFASESSKKMEKSKKYGIIDIFTRGYGIVAVILGFSILCVDIVYFAAHFGVSVMPGNVYLNLIILSVLDLPANLIASFLPNIIGRKYTITVAMMFQAFCLYGAVAVELIVTEDPSDFSIVVLVLVGKVGTSVARLVLNVFTEEIYPTAVRSTAGGYTGLMGMAGSMIAPFVIARDKSEVYICYLLMSVLATICGCLVLMVPETKGKPLADTWEDKEEEEEEEMKKDGGEVEEGIERKEEVRVIVLKEEKGESDTNII